jgi:phosphoribosyl 1,2-cyclic phosphodiesterase
MTIVSLASGSKGNAMCIESGGAVLLIDCGLSGRELKRRAAEAGVSLDALVGAVFTHCHDDHVRGVSGLRRAFPSLAFYANFMTSEAIAARQKVEEQDFIPFENGQTFEIGPFEISAFSIPHDTCDPVGYLVRAEGVTYFHGTDIGTPLESVGHCLAEADVATLESNHDPVLLRQSGRPYRLIQRIAGPRGHLSNDEAGGLVRRFAAARLKRLCLAHLSQDCNAPHLARAAMDAALTEIGRTDVAVEVLPQDAVLRVFPF